MGIGSSTWRACPPPGAELKVLDFLLSVLRPWKATALPRDAYQTDRKPCPVGKRSLPSRRLRNRLPNLTISVMTNVSALPKSGIVVYLGDRRVKHLATSAALT
jgi:hypothetical protein